MDMPLDLILIPVMVTGAAVVLALALRRWMEGAGVLDLLPSMLVGIGMFPIALGVLANAFLPQYAGAGVVVAGVVVAAWNKRRMLP